VNTDVRISCRCPTRCAIATAPSVSTQCRGRVPFIRRSGTTPVSGTPMLRVPLDTIGLQPSPARMIVRRITRGCVAVLRGCFGGSELTGGR
jgi:hypothetical protein